MGKRAARDTSEYAAQWSDEVLYEELTLPSGRKVLVQPPDVLAMAKLGRIPDHLFTLVEQHIFGMSDQQKAEHERKSQLQLSIEGQRYIDVVVAAACVAPRVVLGEAGAGEVQIERIHTDDRMAIWEWTRRLTEGLAQFPDGAGGPVAELSPVGDGDSDAPAPFDADRVDGST